MPRFFFERTLIFLGIIPSLIYFFLILHYSNNGPFADDIKLIVGDTARILTSNSITDIMRIMFSENAEHRPALLRIMGLLSVFLFGHIDLVFINVISSVLLFVGIGFFSLEIGKHYGECLLACCWILTWLAAPVHYQCMYWAACSASQYMVIALGAIALHYSVYKGWRSFLLFEFIAILTAFSLVSGLLLFPLGHMAICVIQEKEKRKNFHVFHFILWILVLLFYFYNFEQRLFYAIDVEMDGVSAAPLQKFLLIFLWFFRWLGVWSSPHNNLLWGGIVGAVEFSVFVFLLLRYKVKLLEEYPKLTLFCLYMLATIFIGAIQRSQFYPVEFVATPRYKTYAVCFSISLGCLVFAKVKPSLKWVREESRYVFLSMFFLVITSVFFLIAYANNIAAIRSDTHAFQACLSNWRATGKTYSCLWHEDKEGNLEAAKAAGIFN